MKTAAATQLADKKGKNKTYEYSLKHHDS